MKVYQLRNIGDVYQRLRSPNQDVLDTLIGEPVKETWDRDRVRVHLFRELDDFENRLLCDFPYLTAGVPVLTPRSLEALRGLIAPHAEVLPLLSEDGEFFALNVTTLPKALDYERSELTYYPSTGRLMSIERYAFIPEQVAGLPIFKLPEFRRSRVYVTDPFVERVREYGLTGFKFNLLWED